MRKSPIGGVFILFNSSTAYVFSTGKVLAN